MESDNLQNDFTNSHLKEALPDLIKENYKVENSEEFGIITSGIFDSFATGN